MKKLLLAAFLLAGFVVQGQISIVQNDMPFAGNELFRTRANVNPFLNYQATGANHVWNFNLTANVQDSTSYQTVGSTNFVYALAYADIFFNPNRANLATAGVDIPFNNLLPIDNPYTFYYRSSSVYKKVGYGVELSGIPVPIIYTDHDEVYNLPLNYGDLDSNTSAYNISIPTLAYYGYEQSRVNDVDGWGVITTPAGTFDVLRVKTTLYGRDTINLDSLSIGFTIDRPIVREYKWLANNFRVPIMQVNTSELFGIEIITDIFFYDEPRTLNVTPPLAAIICPGATIDVAYTKTGTFNSGGIFSPANIFRAQLSDATGSFAAPVNIGSVTSTQSGIISCVIPANTPPGTGYRIRVISTNPALTGNDNGFDITIDGTLPVAAVSSNGPVEFCLGDSVLLSATTGSGYTYQWQLDGADISGATGSDYAAVEDGDYSVVVTNSCGSVTSSAVSVSVYDLPEHSISTSSNLICDGDSAIINGLDLSGQTTLSYQWYLNGNPIPGAIAENITTADEGDYTLEVTNTTTGCVFLSSPLSISIDVISAPVISAAGSLIFCDGGSVELSFTADTTISYQWVLDGNDITGETGSVYTATTAGSYTVTATSLAGCTASSQGVDVTVDPLPTPVTLTASGNTTFCDGDSVTLSFTGDSLETYQWQLNGTDIAGETGTSIVANITGSYTVVSTNAAGCTIVSASTDVISNAIPAAPVVTVNGNTEFCDGDSLLLETVAVLGYNYQWTINSSAINGAVFNSYSAGQSGSYNVIATDMNGCSAVSAPPVEVIVNPLPAVPVITQSYDTLFASPASGYQWYLNGNAIPGANGPFYIVTVNGDYTVEVTDSNSCANTSTVYPFNSVGISEGGNITVSIYPNPTNGILTVETNEYFSGNITYSVFEISGKKVEEGKFNRSRLLLDFTSYAKGIYVLKLNDGHYQVIERIIKQ